MTDTTARDGAVSFIADAREHLLTAETELLDMEDGDVAHVEEYLDFAEGAIQDARETLASGRQSDLDREREWTLHGNPALDDVTYDPPMSIVMRDLEGHGNLEGR